MHSKILFICILASALLACKKDKTEHPESNLNEWKFYGSYGGTLTIEENSSVIETDSTYVGFDSPDTYFCELVNNTWVDVFGQGYYGASSQTSSLDSIYFQDSNYYTANFDWNLILHGSYEVLSVTDTSLSFQKFISGNNRTYRYNLEKM